MNFKPLIEPPADRMETSLSSDATSIADALDDAVAQLQAAAGRACPVGVGASTTRQQYSVDPAIVNQSPTDAKATLDLIEAMCRTPDRRSALECLVRAISPPGTSSTVRAGVGAKQMKSLLDSRLGWIGSGTELFDQVGQSWGLVADNKVVVEESQEQTSDVKMLSLPAPTGAGQCHVWIHDDPAASRWLDPVLGTIASVLWSRPKRKLPFNAPSDRNGHVAKILVAAVLIASSTLAAWPVPYRVACNAVVETTSGRFISTPFEARLLEVKVKPGETVVADQTLLVLDGRPLRLERESLEAELQQAMKEHDAALASRRIADAQQAALRQKKLQRKMQLVTDRLGRLIVASPIDGVIVSGDLQRHIGSPLEMGQTLMEVASMDRMTIELEIPEHEIGFVSKGIDTRIKIDAIGGQSMDLPLDEIYPAAELRDDQNVFVGRVDVINEDGALRPGMHGKATAYGPMRPLIWSWVRGIYERCLWWIGY